MNRLSCNMKITAFFYIIFPQHVKILISHHHEKNHTFLKQNIILSYLNQIIFQYKLHKSNIIQGK